MSKQSINLFINTTSLFMSSWLSIKVILLLGKFLVASYFNIKFGLQGYNLSALSESNSTVWTYASVKSYFSVDIILLLLLTITSVILLLFKDIRKIQTKITLWGLLLAAVLIMFTTVVSSVTTRSHFYYFLDWLYISYSLMLLGGMIIFFVGIGVIAWIINQFLKLTSEPIERKPVKYILMHKFLVVGGVISLVILYLPYLSTLNKFIRTELVISIIFICCSLILKKVKNRQFIDELTLKLNRYHLFVVLVFYSLFLMLNF